MEYWQYVIALLVAQSQSSAEQNAPCCFVRASIDRHLFDCISNPERGAVVRRRRSDWHYGFGWVFLGVELRHREEQKNILILLLLLLPCAAPFPGFFYAYRLAFSSTDFFFFFVWSSLFQFWIEPRADAETAAAAPAALLESITHGAGFHRDLFILLSPPQQIMLPKLHHQRRN